MCPMWFGPPERNTLRPLRVVLLLGLWMSLSSASKSLLGLDHFSNGRLPFIEQGGRVQALDPDRWAQQGCILYLIDTNGATVMENLLLDTLHRPVDHLTEGGLLVSHRRGTR